MNGNYYKHIITERNSTSAHERGSVCFHVKSPISHLSSGVGFLNILPYARPQQESEPL